MSHKCYIFAVKNSDCRIASVCILFLHEALAPYPISEYPCDPRTVKFKYKRHCNNTLKNEFYY